MRQLPARCRRAGLQLIATARSPPCMAGCASGWRRAGWPWILAAHLQWQATPPRSPCLGLGCPPETSLQLQVDGRDDPGCDRHPGADALPHVVSPGTFRWRLQRATARRQPGSRAGHCPTCLQASPFGALPAAGLHAAAAPAQLCPQLTRPLPACSPFRGGMLTRGNPDYTEEEYYSRDYTAAEKEQGLHRAVLNW